MSSMLFLIAIALLIVLLVFVFIKLISVDNFDRFIEYEKAGDEKGVTYEETNGDPKPKVKEETKGDSKPKLKEEPKEISALTTLGINLLFIFCTIFIVFFFAHKPLQIKTKLLLKWCWAMVVKAFKLIVEQFKNVPPRLTSLLTCVLLLNGFVIVTYLTVYVSKPFLGPVISGLTGENPKLVGWGIVCIISVLMILVMAVIQFLGVFDKSKMMHNNVIIALVVSLCLSISCICVILECQTAEAKYEETYVDFYYDESKDVAFFLHSSMFMFFLMLVFITVYVLFLHDKLVAKCNTLYEMSVWNIYIEKQMEVFDKFSENIGDLQNKFQEKKKKKMEKEEGKKKKEEEKEKKKMEKEEGKKKKDDKAIKKEDTSISSKQGEKGKMGKAVASLFKSKDKKSKETPKEPSKVKGRDKSVVGFFKPKDKKKDNFDDIQTAPNVQ